MIDRLKISDRNMKILALEEELDQREFNISKAQFFLEAMEHEIDTTSIGRLYAETVIQLESELFGMEDEIMEVRAELDGLLYSDERYRVEESSGVLYIVFDRVERKEVFSGARGSCMRMQEGLELINKSFDSIV